MTWTLICLVATVSVREMKDFGLNHMENCRITVAGGEVQAAGNEVRPYQFEPEAGQAEENGDEIPGVHDDREDIEGRLGNNNWLD